MRRKTKLTCSEANEMIRCIEQEMGQIEALLKKTYAGKKNGDIL